MLELLVWTRRKAALLIGTSGLGESSRRLLSESTGRLPLIYWRTQRSSRLRLLARVLWDLGRREMCRGHRAILWILMVEVLLLTLCRRWCRIRE